MQKTILEICISMVVISILFVLIPNKSMEPTMKFILNMVLISVLIIPILNTINKIDFSKYSKIFNNNKINEEDLKNKIDISNKKNLEYALKIVFLQNGYKDLDISIDINKESKTTNILVKIPKNKSYDEEEIKKIVKNQTGIIPKIKYY